MNTIEKQLEFKKKLLVGLELAYQRLLESKKQKNSPLIIIKDGKIIKVMVE